MLDLSARGWLACQEAVRWRLAETDDHPDGDARRLRGRRAALDMLHCALESDDRRLDPFQMRRLVQLLAQRAEHLRAQPLPKWPGAQYAFCATQLDELAGGEEATAVFERWLADNPN